MLGGENLRRSGDIFFGHTEVDSLDGFQVPSERPMTTTVPRGPASEKPDGWHQYCLL
jgi:hypothetical protein